MGSTTQLKILNVVLAIVFISQAVTGIFGDLLGIPDELFEVFHEKAGFVLVGLVVLHLILNGKWIISQFFKSKPARSKTSMIPKVDIRD